MIKNFWKDAREIWNHLSVNQKRVAVLAAAAIAFVLVMGAAGGF